MGIENHRKDVQNTWHIDIDWSGKCEERRISLDNAPSREMAIGLAGLYLGHYGGDIYLISLIDPTGQRVGVWRQGRDLNTTLEPTQWGCCVKGEAIYTRDPKEYEYKIIGRYRP